MRMLKFALVALLATVVAGQKTADTPKAEKGVAKAVTLSDVHIAVTNAQGVSISDASVAFQTSYIKKIDVGKSDSLELSFGLSVPTVEQVFVRLQHADKPVVKTFPTTGPNSGMFVFKLELGSKSGPRLPRGAYKMDVIVAGSAVKPLQWTVANLEIATAFEYKPPVEVELVSELDYTFPPPPQKPPALLATIFSAAVLAPVLFLLGAWAKIGVNLRGFQPTLWALAFHGCVAAMFGLFVKFWIDLTMFDVLYYACGLLPVMFFTGNQALKHLHYDL